MNLKEVEKLQNQLNQKKENYNQSKAKYDLYMEKLKDDFNCESIKDAEKLYEEKSKELEELNTELEEWEEDFMERLEKSKILEILIMEINTHRKLKWFELTFIFELFVIWIGTIGGLIISVLKTNTINFDIILKFIKNSYIIINTGILLTFIIIGIFCIPYIIVNITKIIHKRIKNEQEYDTLERR